MADCFITRRGGGGIAGLNFEVVGGTTQPTNPKENTIWVNTSTAITGWIFSAENPLGATICGFTSDGNKTLGTIGGRNFIKVNAGKAAYVFTKLTGKYWAPLLVSLDPDAVSNTTSYKPSEIRTYSGTVVYEGVTYYYSRCDYAMEASSPTVTPRYDGSITVEELALMLAEVYHQTENMEDKVWIKTGTTSEVAFNALKKNELNVYPIIVSQYISGAWVEAAAMVYQSGEWKALLNELFIIENGEKNTAVGQSWIYTDGNSPTVSQSGSYLNYDSSGNGYHVIGYGPVDLAGYKTLKMEGSYSITTNDVHNCLAVNTKLQRPVGGYVAYNPFSSSGASIDVSNLTGKHYIIFAFNYNTSRTYKTKNLSLIP